VIKKLTIFSWGKTDFTNGGYASIQKEVDVPIIDQNNCQNLLRLTRLTSTFQLDFVSFMCAGGEAGKGEEKIKILLRYFEDFNDFLLF
jgi:hypothetical protein